MVLKRNSKTLLGFNLSQSIQTTVIHSHTQNTADISAKLLFHFYVIWTFHTSIHTDAFRFSNCVNIKSSIELQFCDAHLLACFTGRYPLDFVEFGCNFFSPLQFDLMEFLAKAQNQIFSGVLCLMPFLLLQWHLLSILCACMCVFMPKASSPIEFNEQIYPEYAIDMESSLVISRK